MADSTDNPSCSERNDPIQTPRSYRELRKFGIRKLRKLCDHFGLEISGTRVVLEDRVAAFLNITTTSQKAGDGQQPIRLFLDESLRKSYSEVTPLNRLRLNWVKDCRKMPAFDLEKLKKLFNLFKGQDLRPGQLESI